MAKKKLKKKDAAEGIKTVDVNKKARRDYEILDTAEAGIVLRGSEIKSIRNSGISLRDSYIRMKGTECFLVGCHIAPYQFAGVDAHDPYADRKLLLHRKEIERFAMQVKTKGRTLVPLRVYFNKSGRCKIELGVGRGKKLYDKREDIKGREAKRDLERAIKQDR
jgi:SsrA-binding protein